MRPTKAHINCSYVQIDYIDDKEKTHRLLILPEQLKAVMDGLSESVDLEYKHEITI